MKTLLTLLFSTFLFITPSFAGMKTSCNDFSAYVKVNDIRSPMYFSFPSEATKKVAGMINDSLVQAGYDAIEVDTLLFILFADGTAEGLVVHLNCIHKELTIRLDPNTMKNILDSAGITFDDLNPYKPEMPDA